jgi:glycerophosphoryl diester phosphodiesterase
MSRTDGEEWMSIETGRERVRMPELIHHAANCGRAALPNSLEAISECLSMGAQVVEIDIIPLRSGDFALLHDQRLENGTSGHGNAAETTGEEVRSLFYKKAGQVTDIPVGTLSQVLSLVQPANALKRLQLDLKPYAPLTPAVLHGLAEMIAPVKDRVEISSVADWAIRLLHRVDPKLNLGFDPLLYIDLETQQPRPEGVPPFRVGAYGYRDDHPLSVSHWGSEADYLSARAEALLRQAPMGATWYINAALLIKALQAGFDWIDTLHQNGSRVAAWTLDAGQPVQVSWAIELASMGVDAITSNAPVQLAQAMTASMNN